MHLVQSPKICVRKALVHTWLIPSALNPKPINPKGSSTKKACNLGPEYPFRSSYGPETMPLWNLGALGLGSCGGRREVIKGLRFRV